MKEVVKKVLSTLLIFIISSLLIYMIATINRFFYWCNQNEIQLFSKNMPDEYILNDIDKNKIYSLGENIGEYAKLLEYSKKDKNLEKDASYYLTVDGKKYSIAEEFEPVGYSIWSFLQGNLSSIFTLYIDYSIFVGLAISIAYLVIKSSKISSILKFAFGYFGVILIIPQLYSYSVSHSFAGVEAYKIWSINFYIAYTIIFVLIFVANYGISNNIKKKLNDAFNKK